MTASMSEPLELFYRTHRQGLYSLALTITGSHSLAEDAIQNAFAKMFAASDGGESPEKAEGTRAIELAYVYRAVRNSAIDLCRSGGRRAKLNESLFNGFVPANSSSTLPPQQLISKERHELLQQAIDGLGDDEREAIVLKAFAELTFEQAGQIANVPAKTIATRYRRALIKLEDKLKNQQ